MTTDDFARGYALAVLKEKANEYLPEIVKQNLGAVTNLKKTGAVFWDHMSDGLRASILQAVSPYTEVLLTLDVDDVVRVIMECLSQNRMGYLAQPDWIKENLLAFTRELQSS